MNKQEILNHLKSEEAYLKEIKELHDELGVALFTGTLIKGEAEELTLKMYEKIAKSKKKYLYGIVSEKSMFN